MRHSSFAILISAFVGTIVFFIVFTYVRQRSETLMPVACTEEAKICPDGTAVGRIAPNCEFAPCPTGSAFAPSTTPIPTTPLSGGCVIAGCSGELCIDSSLAADGDIFTPCVYLSEYACLTYTTCKRQENGECGWTENPEYSACLEDVE